MPKGARKYRLRDDEARARGARHDGSRSEIEEHLRGTRRASARRSGDPAVAPRHLPIRGSDDKTCIPTPWHIACCCPPDAPLALDRSTVQREPLWALVSASTIPEMTDARLESHPRRSRGHRRRARLPCAAAGRGRGPRPRLPARASCGPRAPRPESTAGARERSKTSPKGTSSRIQSIASASVLGPVCRYVDPHMQRIVRMELAQLDLLAKGWAP